ncbi:hypothetical protein CH252_19135 [Rhodococcus sp. 06-1477-1B]|nr:hypothetical protein CH252_19135 [Rhodococcus sp. 06-1477-1B]
MAARTVGRGAMVYRDTEGKVQTGWYGQEIDVHEEDLERFDLYNEEISTPETEAEAAGEGEAPDPYDGVTVPVLKAEIATRNADRPDDKKIVPADPGNRPELVAALIADDERTDTVVPQVEAVPDAGDPTWTHERIDTFLTDNKLTYDGIEANNAEKPTREEKVTHILKNLPQGSVSAASRE